ncbi:MAG: DUF3782 domain-containing protein, partial [Nitrospinae bacterium]|nr:DUF3782 domain-containing protein [Nitrospinota bacterium]
MEETNFADLRAIVQELAQAQVRTEARLETLTARVDTLGAQVGTLAVRTEELAQAQVRTEARLEVLALRMEELAQAQLRTEDEVTRLRRTMETQIGGLGARWGMQAEEAFRQGMKTILEEVGFRAERYLTYD